jgi:hypothetical protein
MIPTGMRASALLLALAAAAPARDGEPLHRRIDAAVQAAAGVSPELCEDAEFVRRLHLDLAGRIPSADVARAFLADSAPDKRARLVDRLLAGPDFERHLARTLDLMIMERRPDRHVTAAEWEDWLVAAVAENRPLTRIFADLLAHDGVDPKTRAAAKFVLDREVDPHALTRDIGRVFFGRDLQCAQCHDHPRIDDYFQADYYAIYSFVGRSSLHKPDPKVPAAVAEKAEGDVPFKSVFTQKEGVSRPRMPGDELLAEPSFPKGGEYVVAPNPKDKNVRSVPRYSRRGRLAELVARGDNQAFRENLANRLWAHLMGRALVEPVDLHHAGNPPASPELLDLLADGLAELRFDLRAFLRELALTRTYQRRFDLPADLAGRARALAGRRASLEKDAARTEEAVGLAKKAVETADAAVDAARAAAQAAAEALRTAEQELAKAQADLVKAAAPRDEAARELGRRQTLRLSLRAAADRTREAAAALPGDAELAAAAATFARRCDAMPAEIAAAEETLRSRSAGLAEPTARAAAVAVAALAAEAAWEKSNRAMRDVLDRAAVTRERLDVERRAAERAADRVAEARDLEGYAELYAAARASREASARLDRELAEARDRVARHPAEIERRHAAIAGLSKAADEGSGVLLKVREGRAASEAKAGALAKAAATADEVRSRAPGDAELEAAAARVRERRDRLEAELKALRETEAAGTAKAREGETRLKGEREALARLATELAAARARIAALGPTAEPARERARADESRLGEATGRVVSRWEGRYAIGALAPLTPEQLAWSMMEASGLVARERAAAKAPEADRERALERAVHAKLKGAVGAFVSLFGAGAGQPQDGFFATADQALFFMNGPTLRGWLAPAGGNLADRLLKIEDPKALAEELFLSVLSRRPSDLETADVGAYLNARKAARAGAVQDLAWALLTSIEFRFKH